MTNKKFVAIVLAAALMASIGISIAFMENTDMPGNDIASIILYPEPQVMGLIINDTTRCERMCTQNASCKAWTYVKPGVWGPDGSCLLKSSAPQSVPDECCTSGVKEPTPAAPTRPVRNQTPATRILIKYYTLGSYAGSFDDMVATIHFLDERRANHGYLKFYPEGITPPQNYIEQVGPDTRMHLFYPYSRFNDIMDMLDGNSTATATFNPNNPASSGIAVERIK